jgi:holin-like protein
MLIQLGVLMMFQFIGEALVTLTGIPFPGPLCGMALLLGYLNFRGGPSEELTKVGTTLIDNLGLLFVPAGTAIVAYGALLASDGLWPSPPHSLLRPSRSGVIGARGASTARTGELAP